MTNASEAELDKQWARRQIARLPPGPDDRQELVRLLAMLGTDRQDRADLPRVKYVA